MFFIIYTVFQNEILNFMKKRKKWIKAEVFVIDMLVVN